MDLVSIPENPVPDGATVGQVLTSDGIRLRHARWGAEGAARGTVCLFAGRAEFIEKYFETIGELRARGFAVAALDWRGQGGSQRLLRNPRKGHVDSFQDYDRDLAAFMEQVVLPDAPAPYYALAHSMGANILLRNAVRRPPWFERQVLSTPMLELERRLVRGRFVYGISEVLCLAGLADGFVPGGGATHAGTRPFKNNPLTSDPVRFARNARIVERAPSLGLGAPTLGWLTSAGAAMAEVMHPDFAARVAVPTLMIAAGDDHVVSSKAIERLAFRMKLGSHLVIPGARHELLMERDAIRAQFWAAFDAFVPGTPTFG